MRCFFALTVLFFPLLTFAAQVGDSYEKALKAFYEKDYSAAKIHLKNGLKTSPDFLPARILLGKIYFQQEDCLSSEKENEIALNSGGDWSEILPVLIACKIQLNKVDEGLAIIARYSIENQAILLSLKAKLIKEKEQYAQAITLLNQALVINPNFTDARLTLADIYFRQQKNDQAKALVLEVISGDDSNIPAQLLLARIYEANADNDLALATYDKLLILDSEHTLSLLGKASLLQKLKRTDEALEIILLLRNKMPDNPFVNLLHATIIGAHTDVDTGQQNETQQILRDLRDQLSTIDEDSIPNNQVDLLKGYVSYLNTQYESAFSHFQAYKLNNQHDTSIYKLLAETELKKRNNKSAYQYYLKYVESEPNDEFAAVRLVSLAREFEPFEEYQKRLESSFSLFPKNNSIRNHLVAVYVAQQRNEEAKKILQENSDISDNYQLDIELAKLLISLNELKQAGIVVSNLIAQYPLNPYSHDVAAELYLKAGNTAKAEVFMQQALTLDPDFTPALLALASIRLNEKNYNAANAFINQIKSNDKKVNQLKAALAIEQGDNTTAMQTLALNYEKYKGVDTASSLIELYLRDHQYTQAASLLAEVYPDNRLNTNILDFKVRLALAVNDIKNADKFTGVLFGLYYNNARLLKRLFLFYTQTANLAKQAQVLEQLKNLDVAQDEYLFLVMQYQLNAKKYDNAALSLEKLKQQLGNNISLLEFEYNLLFETKAYAKAEHLISALFHKTGSDKHLKSLIGVLISQEKYREVVTVLEAWIKQYQTDLAAIYLLSSTLEQQNKTTAAITLLEDSLSQVQHSMTHHRLVGLYRNVDDAKALAHAEKAYALSPENYVFSESYGWLLVLNKEYKQGLYYLRLAQAKNTQSPTIIYHVAYALNKLDRPFEAKDLLNKLLKRNIDFDEKAKTIELLNSMP
jgi:putative PEP-CTERM system TPR-repeat lipoprotein